MSGVLSVLLGASAAAPYVGPGDIVASATAWYGLRAYSLATVGANALDIKRASDSTTQTFTTLTNGDIDLASITTFLNATTGIVTQLYDQTGNANHLNTTIGGAWPVFTFSALGSHPGITMNDTLGIRLLGSPTYAQPFTHSLVTERTGSFTTINNVLNDANVGIRTGFAVTTNTMFIEDNNGNVTPQPATANDSTVHAVQTIFNNASSSLYIDGTSTAANIGGTDSGTGIQLGSFGTPQSTVIWEVGIWGSVGFSGTQQSNMNANQHTYWGF